MNYDAVIYDLDGTVVNTFDMNLYPLMKIVEEELGIEMTYDELMHLTCYDGYSVLNALGISTDVYPDGFNMSMNTPIPQHYLKELKL